MLRYLLKTLLQMNLFADSLGAEGSNSSQLFLATNRSALALGNGSQADVAPRIVEHPADLLVSRGGPARLRCRAEGRPPPALEWYKDGERVETDLEDPRSHRTLLPGGSLFFPRVLHGRRGKPDEGVYVCVARNYLGVATSRNASLEVAVLREEFRQPPGDVAVAAGEVAVLPCVPPRGHPEPRVSWRKDGAPLDGADGRLTVRGGKLMVAEARRSDAGLYVCVATNAAGERASRPARLAVFERPAFGRRPLDRAVLAEGSVEFPCQVLGDPRPAARWRKEDGEMPAGRWEVLPDDTLRLHHLRPEDEGTYTCVATSSAGRAEASATLRVHVPPQLLAAPRDQRVAPGHDVTFQCRSHGSPPPAVFWRKEGTQTLLFPGQPPHPTGRFSVSPTGAITISNVQPGDAGSYQCQAISVAGSVLAKARLEVAGAPPEASWGPTNWTVLRVGGTARLPCGEGGTGHPSAGVGWLKDGRTLVGAQPHVKVLENGTLEISGLRVTDSGHYECMTTSPAGETLWGGSLEVRGDGSDLSPPSPEPGVLPGPPSTPVVTNVTQHGVTLTWRGNRDNAATSYLVEAFSQEGGGPWQTVASDVEGETHTVRGLLPNTIYIFSVRAANAHGLSDPSGPSEPVCTREDTSPLEQELDPERVQQELARVTVNLQEPVVLPPATVRLSWTVDHQAPFVLGYRVLCRRRGGRWEEARVARGPGELVATLTGLRRGQDYEVKVRPHFHQLQGQDSAVRSLRTPEAAPSAPPRAVSVVSNGTSVLISWQPPPPDEQNGVIRGYRIWCLANDSRFHLNRSVGPAVLATVLGGLLPGLPYRAQVAAATAAGVGARSAPLPVLLASPPERDAGGAGGPTVAQRWAEVATRPAFLAGAGGALGLLLAALAAWLRGRRRREKELGRFPASFAYAPGGGQPRRRPSPAPLPAVAFPVLGRGGSRPGRAWLEELHTFPRPFSLHGISYPLGGPQPMDDLAPQAPHGAKGQKLGQAVKPPVVSWPEPLPPPPSASELSRCTREPEEEEEDEEAAAGGLGMEEWCPGEDVSCATAASSPTSSSGCLSTATLTPSPRAPEDIPRLRDFQSPRLPRRPPHERRWPHSRHPRGPGKMQVETPPTPPEPKRSRYRREKPPGDLPPPPVPPPQPSQDDVTGEGRGARPPRGQMWGRCSTAGSGSSRGATPGDGRGTGPRPAPGRS